MPTTTREDSLRTIKVMECLQLLEWMAFEVRLILTLRITENVPFLSFLKISQKLCNIRIWLLLLVFDW